MSIRKIKAALEMRLKLVPNIPALAYENTPYTPVAGTPYARVDHLTNTPVDHAVSADVVELMGYMNVLLLYPAGNGAGAADLMAQAIQDHSRWKRPSRSALRPWLRMSLLPRLQKLPRRPRRSPVVRPRRKGSNAWH